MNWFYTASFPDSAVRSHKLVEDDVFLSHAAGFTDCFCGMLPANEMSFSVSFDDASLFVLLLFYRFFHEKAERLENVAFWY